MCLIINIKVTLYYSVYMRTSGEKVGISDEAERVQLVSHPHIRTLSGTVPWQGSPVPPRSGGPDLS